MADLSTIMKQNGDLDTLNDKLAEKLKSLSATSQSTETIVDTIKEDTFINNLSQADDENLAGQTDDKGYSDLTKDEMSQLHDRQDKILGIGFLIGFVICKFVLHFGWIISLVLGGGSWQYIDVL